LQGIPRLGMLFDSIMTARTIPRKDIVETYFDGIGKVRDRVRRHTPFTYIAYHELLPSKTESDFVGLAYKICYYVCLRFFIRLGMQAISPFFGLVPLIPLALDALYVGYRWLKERNIEQTEKASPLTTFFFLTVGGTVLYLLNKAPEY